MKIIPDHKLIKLFHGNEKALSIETRIQTRWILKTLKETTPWATMMFKLATSKIRVVNKNVTSRININIQNKEIRQKRTIS